MKINFNISRIALAGILGLGLALSAASPASADKRRGQLKDEKRSVNQARRQLRRADNRNERQAAKANLFGARQNLRSERLNLSRQRRENGRTRRINRENRFDTIRRNAPVPRTVYQGRFNR